MDSSKNIEILKKIENIALENGFFEAGYIDIKKIEFCQEVRDICAGNSCGNYGKCWACPPAVGTLEECKNRMYNYENMLLVSKKYDIENYYDWEVLKGAWWDFKLAINGLQEKIHGNVGEYLLLSNEGCGKCKTCTYPDAPCRFPDKLHHSLEGYGVYVSALAEAAGIGYINGKNSVTFFGALLFNP